jgi:hypothetical protein
VESKYLQKMANIKFFWEAAVQNLFR